MKIIKNINSEILSQKNVYFLLIGIVCLIIINTILTSYKHNVIAEDMSGRVIYEEEWREAAYKMNFYGIPIFALFFSLFISFIPFKGIRYTDKYLPFAIIISFVLYVLNLILLLR